MGSFFILFFILFHQSASKICDEEKEFNVEKMKNVEGKSDIQKAINKSYNFLILSPVSSKSHIAMFFPLAKELVRRGHKVILLKKLFSKMV